MLTGAGYGSPPSFLQIPPLTPTAWTDAIETA